MSMYMIKNTNAGASRGLIPQPKKAQIIEVKEQPAAVIRVHISQPL